MQRYYEPGSWVILKDSLGDISNVAQVIEDNGGAVHLRTDGSNTAVRAKNEIKGATSAPPEATARRRDALPYGKWTCADGREVLFNRDYKPIWQRTADGRVSEAEASERVPYEEQEWFYDDNNRPWTDRELSEKLVATLEAWGIPAPIFVA